MNDLNITLNSTTDEAVLRVGEAEKIYDPVPLNLKGSIKAPADFAENRSSMIDSLLAHAVFDKKGKTITLLVNESSKFSDSITGVIVMNEFLSSLQINSPTPYTRQGLYEVFRHQRRYFFEKSAHAELLLTLQNFDDKVYVESQGAKDLSKGAQSAAVQSKLTSNLEGKKIVLFLPIIEGAEKEPIELSIELSVQNGQPRFWLIADDLPEKIEAYLEASFKTEKERLQALDIICIDAV